LQRLSRVDLDRPENALPCLDCQAQAFTLWLCAVDFGARQQDIRRLVGHVLTANPFTTLQVVLEAGQDQEPGSIRQSLQPSTLEALLESCLSRPTYLDHYYGLQPGRPNGAKRVVVLLPLAMRPALGNEWIERVGNWATVAWRAEEADTHARGELAEFEHICN